MPSATNSTSAGAWSLINGGTLEIDSPTPYRPVAAGLLKTLGVDPVALTKECNDPKLYESLGLNTGVFFDKETFGVDKLVSTGSTKRNFPPGTVKSFLAKTPFSERVRRDIARIEEGMEDYYPGLTSDQKKDKLWRLSYRDYLLHIVKADPGAIPFYARRTDGLWGCGIDAVSALDCWGVGFPGFQG